MWAEVKVEIIYSRSFVLNSTPSPDTSFKSIKRARTQLKGLSLNKDYLTHVFSQYDTFQTFYTKENKLVTTQSCFAFV